MWSNCSLSKSLYRLFRQWQNWGGCSCLPSIRDRYMPAALTSMDGKTELRVRETAISSSRNIRKEPQLHSCQDHMSWDQEAPSSALTTCGTTHLMNTLHLNCSVIDMRDLQADTYCISLYVSVLTCQQSCCKCIHVETEATIGQAMVYVFLYIYTMTFSPNIFLPYMIIVDYCTSRDMKLTCQLSQILWAHDQFMWLVKPLESYAVHYQHRLWQPATSL